MLKKYRVGDAESEFVTKRERFLGYKPSDFRKLAQYRIDALRIPLMGSNFEDAQRCVVPAYHQISANESAEKVRQVLS